MKMTIEQLLAMPDGMSIEEYSRILETQEKRKRRLQRLSQERDYLEDALVVLSDEVGSPRYQKKAKRLEKVRAEIEKLSKEI